MARTLAVWAVVANTSVGVSPTVVTAAVLIIRNQILISRTQDTNQAYLAIDGPTL